MNRIPPAPSIAGRVGVTAEVARPSRGPLGRREKGIEYARRLLGHANISTTQRYMHLDERELAEAADFRPAFVLSEVEHQIARQPGVSRSRPCVRLRLESPGRVHLGARRTGAVPSERSESRRRSVIVQEIRTTGPRRTKKPAPGPARAFHKMWRIGDP